MKGRKIISDESKALKGTLQPCRARKNALNIKDLINLPDPPDHFDDWSRRIYFNSGETLLTKGILNSLCLNLFLSYCFFSGVVHRLELALKDEVDPKKLNAICRVYADAVRTLKSLAADFGIPPSSAGKVFAAEKKEPSKLQEYMEKYR